MVKSYKLDEHGVPKFPEQFEVINQIVLNFNDIGKNNNKFYTLELHKSDDQLRIFTHYGRVGAYGVKEARFFSETEDAEEEFERILKSKQKKGYVVVEVEAADVGTKVCKPNNDLKTGRRSVNLDVRVQGLIEQIYEEAKKTLSATIKTPLGALSASQIDKGYAKLELIKKAIQYNDKRLIVDLSSQFYSLIPQRFSSRITIDEASIDTEAKADRQEEILQLMRDVYNVRDDLDSGIIAKYKAINANIKPLEKSNPEYHRLEEKVIRSQSRYHHVNLGINNIFNVELNTTKGRFKPKNPIMELFHGSANKNILGILQRGLLIAPPGVDYSGSAFGRGIYFASHSTKSAQYSTKFVTNLYENGFLFVAEVALGRMMRCSQFTFSPPGIQYDSIMGVAGSSLIHDEFIVYNVNQVELKYLIDFKPR